MADIVHCLGLRKEDASNINVTQRHTVHSIPYSFKLSNGTKLLSVTNENKQFLTYAISKINVVTVGNVYAGDCFTVSCVTKDITRMYVADIHVDEHSNGQLTRKLVITNRSDLDIDKLQYNDRIYALPANSALYIVLETVDVGHVEQYWKCMPHWNNPAKVFNLVYHSMALEQKQLNGLGEIDNVTWWLCGDHFCEYGTLTKGSRQIYPDINVRCCYADNSYTINVCNEDSKETLPIELTVILDKKIMAPMFEWTSIGEREFYCNEKFVIPPKKSVHFIFKGYTIWQRVLNMLEVFNAGSNPARN